MALCGDPPPLPLPLPLASYVHPVECPPCFEPISLLIRSSVRSLIPITQASLTISANFYMKHPGGKSLNFERDRESPALLLTKLVAEELHLLVLVKQFQGPHLR